MVIGKLKNDMHLNALFMHECLVKQECGSGIHYHGTHTKRATKQKPREAKMQQAVSQKYTKQQ